MSTTWNGSIIWNENGVPAGMSLWQASSKDSEDRTNYFQFESAETARQFMADLTEYWEE